jgi:4-amino-4-deoxy-L-arabinose transferase-like glycosyltransferase
LKVRAAVKRSRIDVALVTIIAIACAVRLLFLALVAMHGTEINDDGAQYARAAQNVREGLGYIGMLGKPLTLQPPLYSFAIGLISSVVGDAESAGRLISIVAGAALPLPVFVVTRLLFGRSAGLIAAAVSAFMPFLVGLDVLVLTDPAFLTFLMAGLAFAMLAQRRSDWRSAAIAGAFFGVAYLLHPEGLPEAIAVLLTLAALALVLRQPRLAITLPVAFAVPLAVIALPYVAYISRETGRLSFQGKMDDNYFVGVRLEQGMSYLEAAQGIGDDLTPFGPELNSWVAPDHPSLHQRLAFALAAAPHQLFSVMRTMVARNVLTPLGALLVVLGFVRGWRGRSRIELQILLVVLAATMFLALLSVMHFWPRYAVSLMVIAIPWLAKGALDALAWVCRRQRRIPGVRALRTGSGIVVAVLGAWLVVGSYADVRLASADPQLRKQAGLWLRTHDPGPKTIMEHQNITGYYARGNTITLPYTRSSPVALAYIAKQNPTYIELYRSTAEQPWAPYVSDWIAQRIPDRRSKLIYSASTTDGSLVRIYRWLGTRSPAKATAATLASRLKISR